MTDLALSDDLFFTKTGMDRARVERLVGEALAGMDDGELFLEYCQSESLTLDDGRIKSRLFRHDPGLRAARPRRTRRRAMPMPRNSARRRSAAPARPCARCKQGQSGTVAAPPAGTNRQLYTDANPLGRRVRGQDRAPGRDRCLCPRQGPARAPGVASLSGVWQAVQIIRADGCASAISARWCGSTSASSSATATRMESGSSGAGGRLDYRALPRPGQLAGRRSTRRCARRWSISTRCRRRPAR